MSNLTQADEMAVRAPAGGGYVWEWPLILEDQIKGHVRARGWHGRGEPMNEQQAPAPQLDSSRPASGEKVIILAGRRFARAEGAPSTAVL